MKTRQWSFIVVLSLFILPILNTVHAAPAVRMARIEVAGSWSSDQVDLDIDSVSEGGKATPANWAGADPAKHMIIEFPATAGWKEASFTFKPHKSGRVVIALLGSYYRVNSSSKELYPILISYDDIKVEGATLKNPSFEDSDATGKPADWNLTDTENSLPPIDDRNRAMVVTGNAVNGEKALRVWHNSRATQSLQVEAEKPVTISFSYRLAN